MSSDVEQLTRINTMQAIQTKYLPATNFKPSRIKAWSDAGSIIVTYSHEHDVSGEHYAAAQALAVKLGWIGPNYGELKQGSLPNNAGYCHVMVKTDQAVKALFETIYSNAAESPEYIRARIDQFRIEV
jgi:hypothetical protein